VVCLETSFLVDLLHGNPDVKALKEDFDKTESAISVAAPSVMELWSGANYGRLPEKEKQKINEIVRSLIVLPLDEKSAKEAGDIEAALMKSGSPIGVADIMIAGIARANGEKLVTRDSDFAKIPGLQLIKY